MKKKEQGKGSGSLPNRNYVKNHVRTVFQENPGMGLTLTLVWNMLTVQARAVIETAYGDTEKGRFAVYRSIQNWQRSAGNPKMTGGRGQDSTWVYQDYFTHKDKVKDVVAYSTETPEPDVLVVEKDGKLEPVTFKEARYSPSIDDPLEELLVDREPQVGDMVTFTLIGLFLDGTYLWREEATGHVGTMGDFVAL